MKVASDAVRAHLQVAEVGKRAALRGDHAEALRSYREAMRMAVQSRSPEAFFRHYLEASLESLELMGDFDSVLEYCGRAIDHYAKTPPSNDLAWLDLASVYQRRGVVLCKVGNTAAATEAFDAALRQAQRIGATLELSQRLRGWIARGLTLTPERVLQEQRRLRYFSVREETLRAASGVSARKSPL
ncbi:MAG: hypothetical protein OEZ06_01810 [Myxococcales bacterium]|nr:hypothetical protein [Myxococcales bacterium]